MTGASVIGLGSMGSAIARSLLAAHHTVTVWNRSAPRLAPLVALGATAAASLADALRASPTVFICIDAQASTRPLLDQQGLRETLAGRTVIDLSTGTPDSARANAAWLVDQGARVLDAKMLMGPHAIGTPNGILVYAGPRADYDRLEPMLKSLAGHTTYVGEDFGAAATIDQAWLAATFGLFMGVAQGARICASEGVSPEKYALVFPHMPTARWLADIIARRDFDNPGAPIEMWRDGLRMLQQQAAGKNVTAELPDFVATLLDRAIAAGHGRQHIGAVSEVIGRRTE